MPTRIAVYLFEGCEELDWAGPWEVLAMWARTWPDDGVDVFTVAVTSGPVTCAKGLRVLCDHDLASAPAFDVLVFPGGRGTSAQIDDGSIRRWITGAAERGALLTSVCTGSLVYAAAGLLRGRAATSHWASLASLAALDGSIDVRETDRFVDVGPVITAAGVSAGIDMALHLIARLHSPERARAVRRMIQYDPAPPV